EDCRFARAEKTVKLNQACSTERSHVRHNMKYWEIIADNRSKAGWSWGCASAIDCNGRTLFVADAHCDDGKRFVVRADEKLTAFIELEAAIRACGESHKRALHTLNLHTASKTYVEEI